MYQVIESGRKISYNICQYLRQNDYEKFTWISHENQGTFLSYLWKPRTLQKNPPGSPGDPTHPPPPKQRTGPPRDTERCCKCKTFLNQVTWPTRRRRRRRRRKKKKRSIVVGCVGFARQMENCHLLLICSSRFAPARYGCSERISYEITWHVVLFTRACHRLQDEHQQKSTVSHHTT